MSRACPRVPPQLREVEKAREGQRRCLAGMWYKEPPLPLYLSCGNSAG